MVSCTTWSTTIIICYRIIIASIAVWKNNSKYSIAVAFSVVADRFSYRIRNLPRNPLRLVIAMGFFHIRRY